MADDNRYAFHVEWYEEIAARTRTFQFFFYPGSKTIEMFDIKTKKMFLKTSISDNSIDVQDLFIGASINVLGRQLTIVEYADDFTKRRLTSKLERTLGFIKPDSVDRMGEVLEAIYKRGLIVSKLRLCSVNRDEAFKFYQEHAGKSFMDQLLNYVTSGPLVVFELVGENAVQRWRELIGPTNPAVARSEAASSLRARFGKDVTFNAVHGSDSSASAAREIEFFFPSNNRQPLPNCVKGTGSTCCIIKPHAVKSGLAGKVMTAIMDAGFTINTAQLFNMEKANVEEFYEVYKGVVHEYQGMVNELSSGPCIALEIIGKSPEQTPVAFRELVGPSDPEIARHLRPRTLRALFGIDKLKNAVHCTDLPEDASLEVEYFFKIMDR